jgi:hypothetical protein
MELLPRRMHMRDGSPMVLRLSIVPGIIIGSFILMIWETGQPFVTRFTIACHSK